MGTPVCRSWTQSWLKHGSSVLVQVLTTSPHHSPETANPWSTEKSGRKDTSVPSPPPHSRDAHWFSVLLLRCLSGLPSVFSPLDLGTWLAPVWIPSPSQSGEMPIPSQGHTPHQTLLLDYHSCPSPATSANTVTTFPATTSGPDVPPTL